MAGMHACSGCPALAKQRSARTAQPEDMDGDAELSMQLQPLVLCLHPGKAFARRGPQL